MDDFEKNRKLILDFAEFLESEDRGQRYEIPEGLPEALRMAHDLFLAWASFGYASWGKDWTEKLGGQ